ncbi:MAG: amidohydrolase family protein [Clostridiales bacterium]|jgi:predicted TIM-barrel fold metal-dependent hydrolase|nr:amidohydrolase family protein [Clostridiales bacterium]
MKPGNKSAYLAEFLRYGRLKNIKIIDAHTHMGSVYGCRLPVSDAEACMKLLDEENIESIWCSAHADLFHIDGDRINGETKALVRKYPARVKGYYAFNPNRKEAYLRGIGEAAENKGFVGLKFLPNYHNSALDGEGYAEALDFADKRGLLVLCHTWGDKPHNSVKEAVGVLKRHKNLVFILGHSAPGDLDGAIAAARAHENAYLDLCDIHRHAGTVEKMVRGVGAERVLFGTDMPWYDPNYCIGSVLGARITDADREKIFYKNAIGILKRIGKI